MTHLPTTAPRDLADEMLAATARAERAEAALDLAQSDLRYERALLVQAREHVAEAVQDQSILEQVRDFHQQWADGDVDELSPLQLWEQLDALLHPSATPGNPT